jgi:hypothetical protein
MTPQMMASVQEVLSETKTSTKYLIRSLELVSLLSTRDVYVARHVLDHVVSLLKK